MLALASAVIFRSESRGTHDYILLSQIRCQVPVFISPRNRVASYTPRHWVPFLLPPTTRRATVEVFVPASILGCGFKVKVIVALRLTVYRRSVCLGVKPFENHDQRFFFQLSRCGNSSYVTASLTRRWVCLCWICLLFRQVYVSYI
jgi:hypothetical protein